jgi:hypothetical protein
MFVELALNSPNLYFIYEWLENSPNFVFFEPSIIILTLIHVWTLCLSKKNL